jgi:drug/metabolite transporter (DMT)-like permease
VFIGNAYALVIYAMQFIPAAYAVAYTNAGIVVAGVIAMVFFRERERWRTRLAAMLMICAGLALIAVADGSEARGAVQGCTVCALA